jgi:HemK-like putative methylase
VDLSTDALDVARRNVDDYELAPRISLVASDMFAALHGRQYDLIISNPPYVTGESMAALPDEYRHEPEMALGSGLDGLDHVRTILREAPAFLRPGGRWWWKWAQPRWCGSGVSWSALHPGGSQRGDGGVSADARGTAVTPACLKP